MKNEKNKNFIIVLLIIVIVILSAIVFLLATDTINLNFLTNNNKNELSDIKTNNDDNETDNNEEKYDEASFIRENSITLVDEPNCTGNSSPLVAAIESNGNISIGQNRGAVEIEVGNAKYLYSVGLLTCDNFKLYYITEDKELYVIDNPNSTTLNQKSSKATESKIIEFLGIEDKTDGRYLKLLNDNRKIEYIKYFTFPN